MLCITLPTTIDPSRTQASEKVAAFNAKRNELGDDEFFTQMHAACAARMDAIDALPREARLLVHEFGYPRVKKWLSQATLREVCRAVAVAQAVNGDLDI